MHGYLHGDFRRFVYTLGLVPEGGGRLLEIGANPYFTTLLLRRFRGYELTLANYFGHEASRGSQFVDVAVEASDAAAPAAERVVFEYDHFNGERDRFPYPDGSFDVVVYGEVIEHMQHDPLHALAEIRRVLRPGGTLVLTTPNVARLENVLRLVAGRNVYDPYSGYGPYGRHNREYNRHELVTLVRHAGFEVEDHFTADVHPIDSALDPERVRPLVESRAEDLGQYLFLRARRGEGPMGPLRKPAWLYRSYPPEELCA
jgi:SAM-dependent methyltransferase